MSHRTVRSAILVSIPTVLLSMAFVIATAVTLWAAPQDTSTYNPVAAPLSQSTPTTNPVAPDEAGVEYIIQPGDSLYKISGQFYNEPGAYQQIVDATNAKAAVDSRFTRIVDARFIQTGQRLWIPNRADLPLVSPTARDTTTTTAAIPTLAAPTPASTVISTPTAEVGAGVAFVAPLDGAVVSSTFVVTMAANGLTVEPAGTINPGAGHFHILVDTDFVPAGDVIITDDQHIHFGKAQMTTTLTLDPGVHVLRLQFANGAHIALDGDQYRDTITVTVASSAAAMPAMRDGPGVYFVDPLNGATVPPTFPVTMAANDLTVEPAGTINPGAGHFHILVDTDFVPAGDVIITDDQHIHFGKAQMTTTLTLDPGVHVLRLQFANGAHIALDGDQYRHTITVTVASDAAAAMPATHSHDAEAVNVHFVTPIDGATVTGRFDVVMAADGLVVEPAGTIHADAGHFHILVDTDFVPAGDVIINDEQHIHFGKGQAVTKLALSPGVHLLRLQFGNGAHIALAGEQYQDEITVTVAE